MHICLPVQPRKTRGVASTDLLWSPGEEITIAFLGGDDFQHEAVKTHSAEWLKHANLKFKFIEGRHGQVRISFVPGSSWSYIGTNSLSIKNQPTMNLGWIAPHEPPEIVRRTILHEFGHMIGLEHEHQSPNVEIPWDKEAVYEMARMPPNYWGRETTDINYFLRIEAERSIATGFDTQSIMLYPIPASLTGGKMSVGWNNELSEKDIELVKRIYPYE